MTWSLHALDAGRVGVLKMEYFGRVLRYWNSVCNPGGNSFCRADTFVCFDALHRWWRSRTAWCQKNIFNVHHYVTDYSLRHRARNIDITQAWQVAHQVRSGVREGSVYSACDVLEFACLYCRCPKDEIADYGVLLQPPWQDWLLWAHHKFRQTYVKSKEEMAVLDDEDEDVVPRPAAKQMPRSRYVGVSSKSSGAPPLDRAMLPASGPYAAGDFSGGGPLVIPRPSCAVSSPSALTPVRAPISSRPVFPAAAQARAVSSRVNVRVDTSGLHGGEASRSRSRPGNSAPAYIDISLDASHSVCPVSGRQGVHVDVSVSRGELGALQRANVRSVSDGSDLPGTTAYLHDESSVSGAYASSRECFQSGYVHVFCLERSMCG